MGCKYGCVCGGNCLYCAGEPESYCGEAEDLYDEMHGTVNGKQQEEDYEEYIGHEMQEYYESEYAAYISDLEEDAWREEQFE